MSQTHWHVLAASAAINWSIYFSMSFPDLGFFVEVGK